MKKAEEITQEMQYDFDERCAIFEVDGQLTRKEAEWKALYWMQKTYGLEFTLPRLLEGRK